MSTTDHEPFMRAALAQAERARSLGDVPVGAVVVRDGQIIAVGHNRREIDQDPTAHAELLAIREAAKALGSWRLEGCTVYVTLEPCPMCSGLMVLSRVERCVFGARDPKGGFLGTLVDLSDFPGLNHKFATVPGVLGAECSEQLSAFFREIRRNKKLNE
jgi:tRNA(adenine34) deaminase